MSYSSRIKMLEESYRLIESQINSLLDSENPDQVKLTKLRETKSNYWDQLRELRRAEYEENQRVDFDDDR